MGRTARRSTAHAVLQLRPGPEADAALQRTARVYAEVSGWLDAEIPATQTGDLVSLHRAWYGRLRERGLPAQMATLALRDWAARRRGSPTEGVPYDDKLYTIRGLEQVALTTVDGRVSMACVNAGYGEQSLEGAPARLVQGPAGWEFRIGVGNAVLKGDAVMATEGVFARVGRVVAGMAHAAVSAAEQANPAAVLEQAIREIDGAADELRAELGKATAERHRVVARVKELAREREQLDAKIAAAVESGRDDLAEAGIARQLDIEAQSAVLQRLQDDVDAQIAELQTSLDAARASRREAESRLADLRRSTGTASGDAGGGAGGANAASRAQARVERAQAAAGRVTGVPADSGDADAAALEDLSRLHRDRLIQARLAQAKARKG
jgi:phage shock protein A